MFHNCTIGKRLNDAEKYRTAPECWTCTCCDGDLFKFTDTQVGCYVDEDDDDDCIADSVSLDMLEISGVDEDMDFDVIYPDASRFQDLHRQMNNNTPINQIVPHFNFIPAFNYEEHDKDLDIRVNDLVFPAH